jgi:hypothetical protein
MRWHKNISSVLFVTALILGVISAISIAQENPKIMYRTGLLSVEAVKVKPEALIAALGQKCNISVVAHGDVFPEDVVTIRFENLAVREGVKKIVKACGFKNSLIDFQNVAPGNKKFARVELFMSGSGTRLLNMATDAQQKTYIPPEDQNKSDSPQMQNLPAAEKQKDRSEDMGAQTHGSASTQFPEFQGTLDYDKSKNTWQDEAKTYTHKTLGNVPPAYRDTAADYLLKTCDEIAQERGVTIINKGIVAEAFQRMGKKYNMPPK